MSNIKKVIGAIALTSVCLSSVGAEYSGNYNGYQDPIIDSNFEFEAKRDGHLVYMNWDKYEIDDFKYYKILKAKSDDNLFYPEKSAIRVFSHPNNNELKISNYNQDSEFYRVCVITYQRDRFCSPVVKLEGFSKDENQTHYNSDGTVAGDDYYAKKEKYRMEYEAKKAEKLRKKEEYKKEYEAKKAEKLRKKEEHRTSYENKANKKLSHKIEQKARKVINNYIHKVEKKYDNTEDRIALLNKVVDRLKSLAEQKERYRELIEFMVQLIDERINSYEDDFSEIENILNDF